MNGWRTEREGRAVPTLNKTRWLLGFATSVIGDRPIAEITAPELLAVLRKVESRGRYETARRLRGVCGQVFRYAVATGRAERDPTSDLRGALTAPKVKHRAAVIEPKSIGAMLRAIDGFDGQVTTAAALKLAAILFVRPGELRNAEWIEFDLEFRRMENSGRENKDAEGSSGTFVAASSRNIERASGRHGEWSLPVSFCPQRTAPNVGEHLECCFAAPWLQQG